MLEQTFNRIRKRCKNFNSDYFCGEGKFNKANFVDLDAFYSSCACFTFSPESGEISNVISCKKGEAYSLLKVKIDKIKTEKEIFAFIHRRNIKAINLFKKLDFVETEEKDGEFVKYIRKKQATKSKNNNKKIKNNDIQSR